MTERADVCEGCGWPEAECRAHWADQRKCCPDCTHGRTAGDIEWPDHASLPPLDPNEPGGGLLAGMGGTLDIGVPLRDAGGRELRSVEIAPGVLWPDYGMVTIEPEHEHHCIIAREHSEREICLCSCGAVRDMETAEWDEP